MASNTRKLIQETELFADYKRLFVQHLPRFSIKKTGRTWTVVKSALTDTLISHHLAGGLSVASLAQWYPSFALIDVDHARSIDDLDMVRASINLDESNSMLFESETPGHFHILFRATYNGKPMTVKLLHQILGETVTKLDAELYPRALKPSRLPFSPKVTPLFEVVRDWQTLLYYFEKLDELELTGSAVTLPKVAELELPGSWTEKGRHFMAEGLTLPGTRHEMGQAALYCLWRDNWGPELAVRHVFRQLAKSPGLSKDMIFRPRKVLQELTSQAAHIWGHFQRLEVFPDYTQKCYQHLTAQTVVQAVQWSGGTISGLRFALDLVAYMVPRIQRTSISVHSDLLKGWTATKHNTHDYLVTVETFLSLSGATRADSFAVGAFAKKITPPKDLTATGIPVLKDGRPVLGLEVLRHIPEPRELLQQNGFSESQFRYLFYHRGIQQIQPGTTHI